MKKEGDKLDELLKIENGEVKLDSRMIAEHFSKAHSDVLKDIRDEIEKLEKGGLINEGIFSLVEYLDKNGQGRPHYEMSEEGALIFEPSSYKGQQNKH